jgi:hypothetical protein
VVHPNEPRQLDVLPEVFQRKQNMLRFQMFFLVLEHYSDVKQKIHIWEELKPSLPFLHTTYRHYRCLIIVCLQKYTLVLGEGNDTGNDTSVARGSIDPSFFFFFKPRQIQYQ